MIEAKTDAMGRALLFDIDGTLADTDPLHLKAFNQVLGPRGPRLRSRALLQRAARFRQCRDR
ncbi:beta-phosphoglucomutase-like phosphatase (HAD superfamily) [Bradyrhizobium ottawaense]